MSLYRKVFMPKTNFVPDRPKELTMDDLSKLKQPINWPGRCNETAKNLLDWADELEELNIKSRFLGKVNRKRLQLLVKDLHIAAGVLTDSIIRDLTED